jgi:hypothetical protein
VYILCSFFELVFCSAPSDSQIPQTTLTSSPPCLPSQPCSPPLSLSTGSPERCCQLVTDLRSHHHSILVTPPLPRRFHSRLLLLFSRRFAPSIHSIADTAAPPCQ